MSLQLGQIDIKTLQTVEIVATEMLSRGRERLKLAVAAISSIISLRLSLATHNNHFGCFEWQHNILYRSLFNTCKYKTQFVLVNLKSTQTSQCVGEG